MSAMRVLRFASAARAGSACGCSGAVPERRVPIRPTRQCRGKSLYKTQPACIQVIEVLANGQDDVTKNRGPFVGFLAGVDCGFGTFAGRVQVDTNIVWHKLRALVE